MPRGTVSWSQLRVGIFVLGALVILATFIFYVTGGGAVFAPQYRLKTYVPEGAGLTVGSPVRLAGVEVGTVERVRLSEFRQDPRRHVEVGVRVQQLYQADIRTDSEAYVTTEGLLGEGVLEITRGVSGEVLRAGGVIPGAARPTIKEVVYNAGVITDNLKDIVARVNQGQGTVGKLVADDTLYRRIDSAVDNVRLMTARAAAGEGTVGKLVMSEELYNRFDQVVARADTIVADIEAGKGTLGKFIYDPTIHDETKKFVTGASKLFDNIENGKGTLGKLATDDALYQSATKTFDNLQSVTGRLDEGEGTAGKVFRDPQLYDNINHFSTELRALISDFRKNPKKYLRIKFSIF
ncbi:MAG: MCE family protein [Acidobacteria bacterium]|nr:MCE family protein [Acidobacteriota bacterium]